jgi:hypothetical protein
MVFGGARDSETGGVFLEPELFYQNSPLLSSLVVKGKKGHREPFFFLTLLELDEILVGDCDTDVWGWGKKGENCSATLCLNSWSMALVVSQSDEKYKMMENQ